MLRVHTDDLLRPLQNVPATLDLLQITVTKVEVRGIFRIITVSFYHHWALINSIVHFDEIMTMSMSLSFLFRDRRIGLSDLSIIANFFAKSQVKPTTLALPSFYILIFETSDKSLKCIRATFSPLFFDTFLLDNFLLSVFRCLFILFYFVEIFE